MAYIPPHLRVKKTKETRKDFRNEFPQLCAPTTVEPLDYSHIKDIVEPVIAPVVGLPYGWVNLRNPNTYVHPPPNLNALATETITRMIGRWEKWDRENDTYVDYMKEYSDYEDDYSEEESDSVSAEDPEYESDF